MPEESFKQLVQRYLNQVIYVDKVSDECPFFPHHIHIEPTNMCNLRCVHCHHHNQKAITRPFGMMAMDMYKKIINEIAPLKCSITLDVNGEPLLHPQIIEMVAYAKDKGLYTSLLTNATRLTESVSQHLIDRGLDRIVFSFDGARKDVYESIRIRSAFEPALLHVLAFIKLNHERGHHTHVCMSIILQKRTQMHIDEYRRYFSRLPVDKIFVSNLLTLSGGSGACDEIDMAQLQSGAAENWPVCRVPWEDLSVNWDGEVSPCPLDYNLAYSLGNIKDSSLQEMWNNEQLKQFRRAHLEKNYRIIETNGPLCGSCNCLWDPEYDLRRFRDFTVEAIYRTAVHYAHQFAQQQQADDEQKYKNLLAEINSMQAIPGLKQ